MNPDFRALTAAEHDSALDLWQKVWDDDGRAYFEHYFTADPEYQDEDCRVAVVDGRLVATVLVCRRRMEWEGSHLLCGAVANVATLKEYRRRGLSRELLRQAIVRMEAEGFAFSTLFTGSYGHYRPMGWYQVPTPSIRLEIANVLPPSSPICELLPGPVPQVVQALYDAAPHRPLHLTRPPRYFEGWTGWFWRRAGRARILLTGPENQPTGYAVLSLASDNQTPSLLEMRAMDKQAEADLLRAAADRTLQSGSHVLQAGFIPQLGGEGSLQSLGVVKRESLPGMMLRAISLPADEMARIEAAYLRGAATFWSGDDF